MQNSNKLNIPKRTGIVCHDAGAANHILSWVCETLENEHKVESLKIYLEGPAKRLLKTFNHLDKYLSNNIHEVLENSNILICGTGWQSNIEFNAIELAKKNNIYSIAVIDHWTNYRSRFVRGNREIQPDEIWVTDKYAAKLAREMFPNIIINQKKNVYLENSVKKIKKKVSIYNKRILYLLEPIRENWKTNASNHEFDALNYFKDRICFLTDIECPEIKLKPHPSESKSKYDFWVSENNEYNIVIDDITSLEKLISWSDVVVGCQTYAMIIALTVGKKVFSSIPPWAPPCVLPFPEIKHLSSFKV